MVAPDITILAPQEDPLSNSEDLVRFLTSRSVRTSWIALWCLWMVWAFLFLAKHVLSGHSSRRVGAPHHATTAGGAQTAEGGSYVNNTTTDAAATRPGNVREKGTHRGVDGFYDRVARAANLARDLTLFLLIGLTVNSVAHGAGMSVLILAWIFFALSMIWLGLVLVFEHFIVDVILGTILFGIILAILSIAYHYGW